MKWYQSKTNWTTILAAIANLISVFTGINLPPGFNEVAVALIFIFMRQGVTKSSPEGN